MSKTELIEVKDDVIDIFVELAEDKLNSLLKIAALLPIPKIKIVLTLAKGVVVIGRKNQLKIICLQRT